MTIHKKLENYFAHCNGVPIKAGNVLQLLKLSLVNYMEKNDFCFMVYIQSRLLCLFAIKYIIVKSNDKQSTCVFFSSNAYCLC